jgi:hypothetical protein
MIDSRIASCLAGRLAAARFTACLCAGAIVFTAAFAAAQQQPNPPPPPPPPPAEAAAPPPQSLAPPPEKPGFLASISQWWNEQAANLKSSVGGAASGVENFGQKARQDADDATKSTVTTVKDAAGAMIRIPATRLVSGNEQCALAANGAPDCVAAATALCRAKGFASGASAATTSADVCKPEVYLAGRNRGPGCHTETFVSSALCQ